MLHLLSVIFFLHDDDVFLLNVAVSVVIFTLVMSHYVAVRDMCVLSLNCKPNSRSVPCSGEGDLSAIAM